LETIRRKEGNNILSTMSEFTCVRAKEAKFVSGKNEWNRTFPYQSFAILSCRNEAIVIGFGGTPTEAFKNVQTEFNRICSGCTGPDTLGEVSRKT